MTMDSGWVMGLLALASGALGTGVKALLWSAQQQSRIDLLQVKFEALESFNKARSVESDRRHEENRSALDRIERKIEDYCRFFLQQEVDKGARQKFTNHD